MRTTPDNLLGEAMHFVSDQFDGLFDPSELEVHLAFDQGHPRTVWLAHRRVEVHTTLGVNSEQWSELAFQLSHEAVHCLFTPDEQQRPGGAVQHEVHEGLAVYASLDFFPSSRFVKPAWHSGHLRACRLKLESELATVVSQGESEASLLRRLFVGAAVTPPGIYAAALHKCERTIRERGVGVLIDEAFDIALDSRYWPTA